MALIKKYGIYVLAIIPSAIFLLLLVQKFGGAEDTHQIFGLIDTWSSRVLGLDGLFTGVLGATTIGALELVAAVLILTGTFLRKNLLQGLGGLLGLGIICGAIFFHLFTDLGVNVPFVTDGCPLIGTTATDGTIVDSRDAIIRNCAGYSDGYRGNPQLFIMALIVFACTATITALRLNSLLGLVGAGKK